ncbi:MAG: NAD(P)-dependent oxidoreductase [Bacteroidota bacterium]
MKKVLITGSSGFVGSFLVEECLERGLEVYAGVRASSSRQFLQDDRIHFFEMNFEDLPHLRQQCKAIDFDYVIHCAGLTKAESEEGYMKVNCTYTQNLIECLGEGRGLEKFVFISSLAAYGPADQQEEDLVREALPPRPITAYGRSKLAAEQYIKGLQDFPYLIFRPTAVYGPREKELLAFYKIINRGIEPYIGFNQQQLTFIYVRDLVRIIADSLKASVTQAAYFVSDGQSYPAQYLGQLTRESLSKRTFKIHVPLALVRGFAVITEQLGRISGKYPLFNLEKVKELESLNWKCDIRPLQEDLGFQPRYLLDAGIPETMAWYKKHNWL